MTQELSLAEPIRGLRVMRLAASESSQLALVATYLLSFVFYGEPVQQQQQQQQQDELVVKEDTGSRARFVSLCRTEAEVTVIVPQTQAERIAQFEPSVVSYIDEHVWTCLTLRGPSYITLVASDSSQDGGCDGVQRRAHLLHRATKVLADSASPVFCVGSLASLNLLVRRRRRQ